ncbi:MAG: hypothetical protein AABM67_19180 [Acidobacteriota bacterium]
MTRRIVFASLAVVFVVVSTLHLLAAPRTHTPIPSPYKITAIKAMLFYDGSATFSRDVLAKPNFTFWNTIIGEGDAKAPSNSTLVLVEVAGNPSPNETAPTRKVELTATIPRKPVFKRTVDIGLFGDGGKFYAAFWLYETGCEPVTLVARIIGQTPSSVVTRKIPFECGE